MKSKNKEINRRAVKIEPSSIFSGIVWKSLVEMTKTPYWSCNCLNDRLRKPQPIIEYSCLSLSFWKWPRVHNRTSSQELCRINNQLLIALGVGHPTVDRICTLLSRYGIHPKMTGAGGGGSLYAFLKPGTRPCFYMIGRRSAWEA